MVENIILVDIRSAQNVGSIFRTADAVGIKHIYLVGITPSPIDRFGRARKDINKASLGAEKSVDWSHHKTFDEVVSSEEMSVVAVEQTEDSTNIRDLKKDIDFDTLVFGNEVDGLPQDILNLCKFSIEIPMMGEKESLNVSVAFGVVLYHMVNLESKD